MPMIRSSESEYSSIRDPVGIERRASTAATSSISEISDHGKAPDISRSFFPSMITASQPPGPGLPIAEPSVKIRMILSMLSLLR
jgi:hypothetical protein